MNMTTKGFTVEVAPRQDRPFKQARTQLDFYSATGQLIPALSTTESLVLRSLNVDSWLLVAGVRLCHLNKDLIDYFASGLSVPAEVRIRMDGYDRRFAVVKFVGSMLASSRSSLKNIEWRLSYNIKTLNLGVDNV